MCTPGGQSFDELRVPRQASNVERRPAMNGYLMNLKLIARTCYTQMFLLKVRSTTPEINEYINELES